MRAGGSQRRGTLACAGETLSPVTWPCPDLPSQGGLEEPLLPPPPPAARPKAAWRASDACPQDPRGCVGAGTRGRQARAGSATRRVGSRSAHRSPSLHTPQACAPRAGGSPSASPHLPPAGICGETAPLALPAPAAIPRWVPGSPLCTPSLAVPCVLPAAVIHRVPRAVCPPACAKGQEFPFCRAECWADGGSSRAPGPHGAVRTGESSPGPTQRFWGRFAAPGTVTS